MPMRIRLESTKFNIFNGVKTVKRIDLMNCTFSS